VPAPRPRAQQAALSDRAVPLTPAFAVERLQRGAAFLPALCEGLPPELLRWKPAPERWSLLEIVNHLADEEAEDFRTRVQLTLRDPAAAWPPIEPQQWVVQRGYLGRDPAESLERFRRERRTSLAWLAALQDGPAWDRSHVHPSLGPLTARTLLANWLAHDLLHGRQMLRLLHQHLAGLAAPATLDYAGPWT
jgi:hypothetical protein